MDTGELLKAWREKVGLSQEELAEAMGVSRSRISDAEANRSSPTVQTLLRFITTIERHWTTFGTEEDERLARFFLGPSAEGLLIVARQTRQLGGPRR